MEHPLDRSIQVNMCTCVLAECCEQFVCVSDKACGLIVDLMWMEEMYSACYLQTLNQPIISQLHPTIEDDVNIAEYHPYSTYRTNEMKFPML